MVLLDRAKDDKKSGVCGLLIYRIMEKIMKTAEELNALKEDIETLNKKLAELSEEELKQVTGGLIPPYPPIV